MECCDVADRREFTLRRTEKERLMLNRIFLLVVIGAAALMVHTTVLASEDFPPSKGDYTVTSLTVEPPPGVSGLGPVMDQMLSPVASYSQGAIYPLDTLFLKATYYHGKFFGRRTASGETYDPEGFTCAHRSLPFNTLLKVSYGDKSVVVRVNDRGPFRYGKSLDLSFAAARELDMLSEGVQRVRVKVLR
jgi:hypothetical protein